MDEGHEAHTWRSLGEVHNRIESHKYTHLAVTTPIEGVYLSVAIVDDVRSPRVVLTALTDAHRLHMGTHRSRLLVH